MRLAAEQVATTPRLSCASRVVVHCSAVALLTVLVAGCQGTKGSGPLASRPVTPDTNQPFWNEPAGKDNKSVASLPTVGSGGEADASGILAGRVVDSRDRAVGVSYVQVQPVEDRPGQAPVDVETTPQGHFYVRGLTPGQSYRLIARTRQDGKVAVGEVVARPPAVTIVIAVSDDYTNRESGIGSRGSNPGVRSLPDSRSPSPDSRGSGIEQIQTRPPSGDFLTPSSAENLAASASAAMPSASIASPGLPSTTPQLGWEPQSDGGAVPDCLVSNGRLLTLRLKDPDGRVWDFANHQGKLVLIDFWGSWCTPCLKAIPELTRLQQTYRTRGLEVVGIACENGSNAENVDKVKGIRRRMPYINYRLLVGGEPGKDPVREQFHPPAYPYLVLLDSDGTILWRGKGAASISELEPILRKRLSN
jgi:thiol-disulfide isomerase/thioredoxin